MAKVPHPALTQESHRDRNEYYRMRPGREKETSTQIIVSFLCLGRIFKKNSPGFYPNWFSEGAWGTRF